MKKQTGMKIYLWLCGVVLPLWLMNYFIGQPDKADSSAPQSRKVAEQYQGAESPADRQQALLLKLSYTLSQNFPQNFSKHAKILPAVKYREAAALNMSFFLSQANAIEIDATQSAAAIKKDESDRRLSEHLNEVVLNIDKLSRQKLAPAKSDPFVAKLPPPPPPAPPPPPPVPVAPAFPYTFMGRMIENDTTTLFLTKQNQSYSVKLNSVLENNYRVDKIDNEQVIFTYLPLNTQQILYIGRAG